MRVSPLVLAGCAVATALVVAGCSSDSKTTSESTTTAGQSTTSTPAAPVDYTGLLIQPSDINAPEVFTAPPRTENPNGQTGVTTRFSNEDGSHVINDTILILPDDAAAASAMASRKTALDGIVRGAPAPIDVGTGGTTVSGPSPDGSKGVTVLLFTEGRAFAELEFDGPPDVPVPMDFVTDVGRTQDTAIKQWLAG